MTCLLCGVASTAAICDVCKAATGVREMAPPRRRPAPCTRCNHHLLIRVIPRELSVATNTLGRPLHSNYAHYAPMFATYQVKRVHRLEPDRAIIDPPQAEDGYGAFEMYICKRCGFVEWYCYNPQDIPIGPEYMTEEVSSDPGDAPYR